MGATLRRVAEIAMLTSCPPRNILLVANYESDVGFAWWLMENFWSQLSHLFSRNGAMAFLIYPRVNEVPRRIRESPITVLECDFADWSREGASRLRAIVEKHRIAHVYLTDRKGYDLRYPRLRRWGVRTIVNHDHSFRVAPRAGGLRRLMKSLLHRGYFFSCDHYIAVSRYIQEQLLRNGVPSGKISVVLNGIEPIEIESGHRHYAHQEFGIPRDALIVVSTGRASVFKGIDSLIECAKMLVEQGDDRLYFLHCGDGPDLRRFEELAGAYGLSDRFLFAGRRADVRRILPSCDIGIQISRGEALSLALLEYLSAGLATLASDVGGNREVIEDGKTGFLFPLGDLDRVVKTLQSLAADEARRTTIGRAARESIVTKFDIRQTNRAFIALYEKILANSGPLAHSTRA